MAAADATHGGWDAINGVWIGNKALMFETDEIPRPLIIFGYGSLCWKPDAIMQSYEKFPCTVRGWTRMFVQKSSDHRGTPQAPGLVATLCEIETLRHLPGFDSHTLADTTLGMAYVIPESDTTQVLNDLDFREKGGYIRRVIHVERLDGGASDIKALLYTGTVDNPNFWWGDDGQGFDFDHAARIIANAVGPSGPNVDYLRNLSIFLESMGHHDPHVSALLARVNMVSPGVTQPFSTEPNSERKTDEDVSP